MYGCVQNPVALQSVRAGARELGPAHPHRPVQRLPRSSSVPPRLERSRASRPGPIRASRIHPDLAREASWPPTTSAPENLPERPVTRRNILSRHAEHGRYCPDSPSTAGIIPVTTAPKGHRIRSVFNYFEKCGLRSLRGGDGATVDRPRIEVMFVTPDGRAPNRMTGAVAMRSTRDRPPHHPDGPARPWLPNRFRAVWSVFAVTHVMTIWYKA